MDNQLYSSFIGHTNIYNDLLLTSIASPLYGYLKTNHYCEDIHCVSITSHGIVADINTFSRPSILRIT